MSEEQSTDNNNNGEVLIEKNSSKCDKKDCYCNNQNIKNNNNINPVCSLFPVIKTCQFDPFSSNYIPIFHDNIKKNKELLVNW